MKVLGLFIVMGCLVSCAGLQSRYHEVERGESLSSIATQYRVPVTALKAHNFRRLASGFRSGMKLYIPFEASSDWDKNELAEGKSERAIATNAAVSIAPSFSWPVRGYVSSGFGRRKRRMHEGVDIAAPQGTRVMASRSGHVIYAGNQIAGYGNMVILRHPDAFSTVYAHLSKIDVKKGQFVTRGKVVGRVGKTGHAHGSHLHFEVRNPSPVDPLFYLHGQYAANKIALRIRK